MTKTQFQALWAAFKKNGAWYGRTSSSMGGAYRRMCKRLAEQHLVSASAPYPITLKGMQALRDACHQRWAKSGCMAYQDDLKEIEQALITPVQKIEDRGLSIIAWRTGKASITQYAVSIDGIGPNEEPSEEQKRFCTWANTAERAATLYIKRNPDHF